MALTKSLKEIIAEDKTGLLGKHQSWARVCLRDVAEVLNGYPFESNLFQSASGMPLIRIRDVQTGSTNTYFSGEFDNQFLVNPGELLVGMDGDFNSARWKAAPSLLNQRVCKLTVDERFYSDRLLELVLPGFLAAIHAETSSVTVKHLSSRSIQEIELPLPPAAEQTRIVEKLEELLSDLDAGVAELKAAQKKLAQYRQSLLKAAVEGALTADWRKSQAAAPAESGAALLARILTERRSRWETRHLAKFQAQGKAPPKDWQAKYLAPVAPDTAGLPALPQGWVWATVEQLGDVQLGRQRSPDKLTGLNPAPYIRAANITEQGIDFSDVLEMDFSDRERETFQLKSGDVLLTEASGSPQHVGRPVIWPNVEGLYCFQNTVIRFSPLGITSEFAFQLFLAWQKLGVFRRLSGGVGINHLSAGKFSALAVPLPPLTEQTELVSALSRAFESLALQEQTIEHSLKQSAAQRKNILQAAFSGQLVPQDPADEPASALLARIRAERAAQPKLRNTRQSREVL